MTDFFDQIQKPHGPAQTLIHGACPEALVQFEDNCFHSVVTDPPAGAVLTQSQGDSGIGNYHIYRGDLGSAPRIGAHKGNLKEHLRSRQCFWDSMSPVWKEVYRTLRPGGYGVIWAHSVTSHWTALSLEDNGFEVRDTLHAVYNTGSPLRGSSKNHIPKELDGWNSKVVTAVEHWILVRKPPEGTLADNFAKWGTGFLNVKACGEGGLLAKNIFHTNKPSQKEKEGNPHPTPKSIDQMRWLVRLVTPPNGIVLDPFGGSGTTAVASMLEGFSSVVIEMREDYSNYARNRLTI